MKNDTKYHKIQSVFMRDERGKFLPGQFSMPEFAFLADVPWVWREKIDGMNMRVIWDGPSGSLSFAGKTDAAQIPPRLLEHLRSTVTCDSMRAVFGDSEVVLYGEGFGEKIQSGGDYVVGGCSFALFDVTVGGLFLEEVNVSLVAVDLGISRAPIVGEGTLSEAIELFESGEPTPIADSVISERHRRSEGIVLLPKVPLCTRRGERLITKLKWKDFA